jgi:hypothetical protein
LEVGSLELAVWSWQFKVSSLKVGSLELAVWSRQFESGQFGVIAVWK